MIKSPYSKIIKLIAVGDIMLGDSALCPGFGVGSIIKKNGAEAPFEKIASNSRKGDIVFGNLEAVLSYREFNSRKPRSLIMKAPIEAVQGLKFAGFNVLSLANNHILEYGKEAVVETKNSLSSNGINYVGIGEDAAKARQPLFINTNEINVAFLAYCLILDKTAYISTTNPEEIYSDIKEAKNKSDLVIVSMHWGNEYIDHPSSLQINMAHRIIDSGANVLLGHHPHVLQGVEFYHHGLIAYSMGNCIFGMNYIKETRDSIMLECQLSKQGVVNYEIHPLYIDNKYRPVILEGKDKIRALAKLKLLIPNSEQFPVSNSQEYNIAVEKLRKRMSRRMIRYFISNLYRYQFLYSWHLIYEYFNKRLK